VHSFTASKLTSLISSHTLHTSLPYEADNDSGGEEEEMGGEPRSEEREESGVQAGPAQHSNARRPSRNVVTPARLLIPLSMCT